MFLRPLWEMYRLWRVKRLLRQYSPEVQRMALETVERRRERSTQAGPPSDFDASR